MMNGGVFREPCPECGEPADLYVSRVYTGSRPRGYRVECGTCEEHGPSEGTVEAAGKAWDAMAKNRREPEA